MKQTTQGRIRRGFMLIELLLAMGFLTVLMGAAAVSGPKMVRDTRQEALDRAAEQIYTALSRTAAAMQARGLGSHLVLNGADSLHSAGGTLYRLNLAKREISSDGEHSFRVSSEDTDAIYTTARDQLVTKESIGDVYYGGCWLVTYSALENYVGIDSVYYSRAEDRNYFIEKVLNQIGEEPFYLESRVNRLSDGAYVGYYAGGGNAENGDGGTSGTPSVPVVPVVPDPNDPDNPDASATPVCWLGTPVNREKLSVTAYCQVPDNTEFGAYIGAVDFTLELLDAQDQTKKCVLQATADSASANIDGGRYVYAYTFILDSLAEGEKRFCKLTEGSGIKPGADILLRVSAVYQDSFTEARSEEAVSGFTGPVNSLFARRAAAVIWSDGSMADAGYDTVEAAYGRHLQNLDTATSGFAPGRSIKVLQTDNIYFSGYSDYNTDKREDSKLWQATYPGRLFTPVENADVREYDGKNHTIHDLKTTSDGEFAGLFGTFSDGTLKNIRLDRATAQGTSAAGGLAGRIAGKTEISNSFAAGWIDASGTGARAGGLVGQTDAALTVKESYADCYLSGDFAGGLLGGVGSDGSAAFTNCYSAGFLTAKAEKAAGIVPGMAEVGNCWSLFNFDNILEFGEGGLIFSDGYVETYPGSAACLAKTAYALVRDGTVSDGFYTYGGPTEKQDGKGAYRSIAEMIEGERGAKEPAEKHPYEYAKVLKDTLENAVLPNFLSLPHYGDWLERRDLTVTFYHNGRVYDIQTVHYNDTAKLPEGPEKTGYTLHWTTDSVGTEEYDFTTPVTRNLDLFAQWIINQYTVTFYDGEDEIVTPQTVDYNSTASKPATPEKEGYTFDKWTVKPDGTGGAYDFTTPVTEDLDLFAQWNLIEYAISYVMNDNGDSDNSQNPDKYTVEETVTLAEPTRTGYTFGGWYTDAALTAKADAPQIPVGSTGDKTFYAQWTINQYTVSFYDGAEEIVTAQTVDYNNTASKPENPEKTGYTFDKWTVKPDGTGGAYDFTTPVTMDLDLYAQWNLIEYAISYVMNDNDDSDNSQNPDKYTVEETVTLAEPTRTGYTFGGWYTDAALTAKADAPQIPVGSIGDKTFYAKWTINQYTVTFYDGAEEIGTAQTVDYNSTASKPETPEKNGYTFDKWTVKSDGTGGAYDFTTPVTEDLDLFAQWTPKTYTVTYHWNYDGAPSGGVYGTEQVKYLEQAQGPEDNPEREGEFVFLGWTEQPDGTGDVEFPMTVYGDTDLYAQWGSPYKVTFHYNYTGSPADIVRKYAPGSSISVPPAVFRTGYKLLGWTEQPNGTEKYDFSKPVTKDLDLYAQWDRMIKITMVSSKTIRGVFYYYKAEDKFYSFDGEACSVITSVTPPTSIAGLKEFRGYYLYDLTTENGKIKGKNFDKDNPPTPVVSAAGVLNSTPLKNETRYARTVYAGWSEYRFALVDDAYYMVKGDGEYLFLQGDASKSTGDAAGKLSVFTAKSSWKDPTNLTNEVENSGLIKLYAKGNNNSYYVEPAEADLLGTDESSIIWTVKAISGGTSFTNSSSSEAYSKNFRMSCTFGTDPTPYYLYLRESGSNVYYGLCTADQATDNASVWRTYKRTGTGVYKYLQNQKTTGAYIYATVENDAGQNTYKLDKLTVSKNYTSQIRAYKKSIEMYTEYDEWLTILDGAAMDP